MKSKIVKITPDAKRKVDAIADQARDLGWTNSELYSTEGEHSFPTGRGWGLICFVNKHSVEISKVTKDYIELVNSSVNSEAITKFYRWGFYYPNWDKE